MKRRILFIALLVLVFGALAWLTLRPREQVDEPVYQGKTLSEWLATATGGDNDAVAVAAEAIQHIGTDAIPTLLRMLRAHDSQFKFQLARLIARQHLVKLHIEFTEHKNSEAAFGFQVLGASASNAVPALIHSLKGKTSEVSEQCTIASLGCIGPAAGAAVPELLRALGDTKASAAVHGEAAWALVQVHADPGLVVPVLAKCLKDSDSQVRSGAAFWLGELSPDAQAAIPALVDALKDRDPMVKLAVKQALRRINPGTAVQAGIQ